MLMIPPTPSELHNDAKHEAHLNGECDDDCAWCEEIREIKDEITRHQLDECNAPSTICLRCRELDALLEAVQL